MDTHYYVVTHNTAQNRFNELFPNERRHTMNMTIATKEETAEVNRDELADGLETLANNIRSLVSWPKDGILAIEIEALILVALLNTLG